LRERELEIHGLQADFADSRCKIAAADVGYLKPHPRIFQHALELMGTQPEETIYIGDNPVADIAGAQSAGMRAVLRINHETPPLISGLVVPDSAINSFEELPAVFDEWYGDW
jgi:FMN phosphatase YigB (HAD superfamily)